MIIKNTGRSNRKAFIGIFVSVAMLIFDCLRITKDADKLVSSVNKFKTKNEG